MTVRKIVKRVAILLIFFGGVLIFFPSLYHIGFDIKSVRTIESFDAMFQYPEENDDNGAGEIIELDKLRVAMENYNQQLFLTGQSALADQQDFTEPDFDPMEYGATSDVMGYISIDSINIELPIYNGASEANMAKGAVLLAYTSLPIGGENTNSVIAAHTRYKGVDMFRDITKLQVGDVIEVTNYFETISYSVCEIRIIDPADCSNVYIQPGRDMLTLSTCHPFPDNYQRYLVFAERIK